jgi:hypothetical protein
MANKNSKTNSKNQKPAEKVVKIAFSSYKVGANKFECGDCQTEMDGSKARSITAMVDGKKETGVFELTCPQCGKTYWFSPKDVEKAAGERADFIGNQMVEAYQQESRNRIAELRKIWKQQHAGEYRKAERLARKNEWNRQFAARFNLVAL